MEKRKLGKAMAILQFYETKSLSNIGISFL